MALQTLGEQPLEEFFAEAQRDPARLFHLVRHSRVEHTLLSALRERLQQTAHVDPLQVNPSTLSSADVWRE